MRSEGAVGARAGTDKGNEKEDEKSGGAGQEHLILCRRRQISNEWQQQQQQQQRVVSVKTHRYVVSFISMRFLNMR